MKRIAKYFFQGLLVFLPIVGSIWIVWWVLKKLDDSLRDFLPFQVPIGVPLLALLIFITLLGFAASNVVGRGLVSGIESGMKRLPVVNLIYSSLKDLLGAFVGDKRSFDKPVMVTLFPEQGIRVFGFVTCDHFDDIRLAEHVAVYLPQSYNFAGNMLVVRRELVEPVDADSAQFMAFIVSGGVSEMRAAKTVFDENATIALSKKRRR
jgi:uncharacterized membrane protein